MPEDIFADEWRECLEAHYMHVIRTKDRVTEPSLTVVMGQAGFNKSELAELRVRATMHVDASGADFVPDLDVLDAVAEVEAEARIFAIAAPEPVLVPDEVPPEPELSVELLIEELEEAAVEGEVLDEEPMPEPELSVEMLIEEIEEAAVEDEAMDEEPPPEPPREDPDAPQQLTLF